MDPQNVKPKKPETRGGPFICCGAGVALPIVVAILAFLGASIVRPVARFLTGKALHTITKPTDATAIPRPQ